MPRLLLVDDNPSIHKIAETLLAASDIQLVSCGSGDQAMALVNQGDRFDVALLDTTMLGMDGWALLQQLRATEATAKMPVAMMAGVLDIVDPEKLRMAPIQGFLKKPVELRDLGDRVRRLLETPVLPPPVVTPPEPVEASPFLTQPGLRIPERLLQPAPDADILLLGPEDLLEEAPADEAAESAPAPQASLEEPDFEAPGAEAPQELPRTVPEPQESLDADSPLPADGASLNLEELDLDGLRDLSLPASAFTEELPASAVPEFLPADAVPDFTMEDALEGASIPGEEPLPDLAPEPPAPAGDPQAGMLDLIEPLDWSDDSDSLVLPTPPAPEPFPEAELEAFTATDFMDAAEAPEPAEALHEPETGPARTEELTGAPEPTPLAEALDGRLSLPAAEAPLEPAGPETPAEPAAGLEREDEELSLPDFTTLSDFLDVPLAGDLAPEPEAPEAQPVALPEARSAFAQEAMADAYAALAPAPGSAPAPGAGPDPIGALLADPVLMDRLARALVERMGDQILREIAWEVMPELAERLHQQALP